MTEVITLIKNLSSKDINTEITLGGWLRTKRDSKGGFSFIVINDGSQFSGIQVIADNNLSNYDEIKKLHTGASLKIKGTLVESQGKEQF